MATYRVVKDKDNPYLMMNKYGLQDKNLSWKAKGILAYLLSLPDDWQIYETEITEHSSDGIKATRSGIKELIDAGYIQRERLRNDEGKFSGYEYRVYEVPTESPKTENGFSENGERHTTNINLTDNNLLNKDSLYVIKHDEPFIDFYLRAYEFYCGKEHMRVSKENLDYIYKAIAIFSENVPFDEWKDKVREHFETLPSTNNGSILAFFKASYRYFEIDLNGWL